MNYLTYKHPPYILNQLKRGKAVQLFNGINFGG